MAWLEGLGLLMYAWNPCLFKKVGTMWGKVLFSDDDESNSMSLGKVCVRTGVMSLIHEKKRC